MSKTNLNNQQIDTVGCQQKDLDEKLLHPLNPNDQIISLIAVQNDANIEHSLEDDNRNDIKETTSFKVDEHAEKTDNQGFLAKLKDTCLALRGYFFALLTAISWSFSNIFMKKAVLVNPFDQQIILFSVAGLITFAIIIINRENFLGPKKSHAILCVRGLLSSLGYTCLILSLKLISPANCSTISNVGVLLTAVLSRLILKEKIGISHIVAMFLTISGVIMISMQKKMLSLVQADIEPDILPQTENSLLTAELTYLIGTLLALLSTSFLSGVNIVLKMLNNNNIHWLISTVYSVYVGLPLALIYRLVCIPFLNTNEYYFKHDLKTISTNVLYSVAGSACDTIGLIFLNIALKYENPTKITIVRTTNILFVFLFQYFILDIRFELFSIMGAVSIGLGSLLVLLFRIAEKDYKAEDPDSKLKRIVFVKF